MRARAVLTALGFFLFLPLVTPTPAAAQSASAGNVTLQLTHYPTGAKPRVILAFTVRGIASGWASGAPFKGLADRLPAAIVLVRGGDDLNDNSYPNRCASGEFNGIPMALEKLAQASSHPELANAPLVGIGHSHGGDYWNWFNACHPERMAMVFVHASGGVNYGAASLKVPVLYELGTGDLIENGSGKPRAGMFANRGKGAPMGLVIGQGEGHNNVTPLSLGMVIELIEATVKLRIPADADPSKGPVRLNAIDESSGRYWLGNLYTKEIAPYGSYTGDKALTAFLPNETVARKWKETGPGLPMSIMLPSGTCGWCGNPKDEPKTSDNNPDPGPGQVPSPAADGGAPPPEPPPVMPPAADASAPPPPPPSTPEPSNPPPAPPANPSPRPDAAPSPAPPTGSGGAGVPGKSVSGGCTLAPAGTSSAPLALMLLVGGVRACRSRARRR